MSDKHTLGKYNINKYDKNGKYICTYEYDELKNLLTPRQFSTVRSCCRNTNPDENTKLMSALGYQWRYQNSGNNSDIPAITDILKDINKKRASIIKTKNDKKRDFCVECLEYPSMIHVCYYKTYINAAEAMGKSRIMIKKICEGRSKRTKGTDRKEYTFKKVLLKDIPENFEILE